jgi:hypothetical protein
MRIFFCIVILCFIKFSYGQTAAEIATLNSMYTTLGGANWISTQKQAWVGAVYNTKWGAGGNGGVPCGTSGNSYFDAWFGVICTGTTVTSLLLPGNGLVGTLPNINGLTGLQKLFLFSNQISGALPTLSGMTSLTHFYIFGNQITDIAGIAGATKLQKFYFDNNKVATSINSFLPNLPALVEIDGTNNLMTGTIHSNIQTTNALLKNIKLGKNKISGSIPPTLLTHPNLLFIRFQENKIDSSIPNVNLGATPILQVLNFSYNLLTCALPPWIENTYTINIDLRGQNFFCPINVPNNVLITNKAACITVAQTGISPTQKENSGPASGSIVISGTALNTCSAGFQCGFKYPGTTTVLFTASTATTATTVTCPFPLFPTGGAVSVCLSQFNKIVSTACNTLRVYYDCGTKCGANGICQDTTGNCICKVGWTGPLCNLRDCGNCNNGTCNTTSGKCICNPGFLGPFCNFGNISCTPAFVCNMTNGQCNGFTGTCQCKVGWQGPTCNQIFCPNCRVNSSTCVAGKCICIGNWTGPLCDIPNATCNGDCGASKSRGQCNKITGKCQCFFPFTGDNCELTECPLNCSGHGFCNLTTGDCTCFGNYSGLGCYLLNLPCPNNCSGNGICLSQTGECICNAPYIGFDCKYADCPLNCSYSPNNTLSHGDCNRLTGKCTCKSPWTGNACAIGNNTCPNDCGGVGTCDKVTGKCRCPSVNYNTDCTSRTCFLDCSKHGTCDPKTGSCNCDINYTGFGCETLNIPCKVPDCSGNGYCDTKKGVCICRSSWEGEVCNLKKCINNCSYPNGTCNQVTGKCDCTQIDNILYEGPDCSQISCPGDCINNGSCNSYTGSCACQVGFTGSTCSLIRCPSDCSGHGRCAGGVCFCDDKWSEAACNKEKPDIGFIVGLAIGLFLAGIALIVGGFFIWRAVTINQLQKELNKMQDGAGDQQLDEISSDSDG